MAKRQREGNVSVFLGGDSSAEGILRFTGQARLDGHFSGEIHGEGILLIGPTAKVEAAVHATAVIISGEVVGDVVATDRIEMKSPGKLKGNINAPLVVMDEGVLFEGNCAMNSDEARERGSKVTLLASGAH